MNIYAIFRKEFFSYFLSPTIYVVLSIYLVLSSYFFYTDLSLYNTLNVSGASDPVQGLYQYYFNDLRFILMLLMPFVTMRLLAEERKQRTLELLTSYPVRDVEILAGKYLSCLAVFILMMVLTFINILFLGILWGFSGLQPLIACYFGLFLLGCSLIACGIFISSLTEKQVVAGMGTLGIFILFWFLSWNEMMADETVINILTRFSLFDRIEFFFRGVIDTEDVVFFALFTLLFLFMTLLSLKSRNLEF